MKKFLIPTLIFLIFLVPGTIQGGNNLEEFFCIDFLGYPLAGSSGRQEARGKLPLHHEVNIFSEDPSRAWVAGKPGNGIGEKIWFEIEPGIRELLIINGHTMESSSFEANNRVKTAELQIWAAIYKPGMASEIGRLFHGYPASKAFKIELEDTSRKQIIEIEENWDDVKNAMDELLDRVKEVSGYAYLMTLEIREIYPGTESGNTGISEISWNLLPEYAGPGGLGIMDLRGKWENEKGSPWESLELEWYPYYQGWTAYTDGNPYDAGTWEIGNGKISLYSDSKRGQFFFYGWPLGPDRIILIDQSGQASTWKKDG